MARDWELAGYTDSSGTISKPIPPGHLIIPGVITLTDGALIWDYAPSAERRHTTRPAPKTLLNQFVKLWKAPEDRILQFARQNCILWLDQNGLPCQLDVSGVEPIDTWCRVSRLICAMLNIGSDLQERAVRIDEWRWVGLFEELYLERLRSPAESRFLLTVEVRRMLSSWGLGFSMGWNKKDSRFELELDYRGYMLNAVLLQLALTLSNSDSLFVCSGCSFPYARNREKRRPRPGQANFCDECGRKAALRHADQRRKVRNAEARRLASSGLSVVEVAGPQNLRQTSKSSQKRAPKVAKERS